MRVAIVSMVKPRPIGQVEPLCRREGGARDNVGDLIMQPGVFREQIVLEGAIGLADQCVEGGAVEIPGGVQADIDPIATLEPIDPGKPG